MAAAFEDAGFDAAGAVGDFAGGDVVEHRSAKGQGIGAGAGREEHPGGEDVLTRARETDSPRVKKGEKVKKE